MIKRVQKPDLIIALLAIFLVILMSLGFYLKSINQDIKVYGIQVRDINKLRLINKDFNHFALQKSGFINYDIINQQIKEFEDILDQLTVTVEQNDKNPSLVKTLQQIKYDYQQKVLLLEHIKSYNSTISSSINYLYDLKKNINKFSPIKKNDLYMIGSTLFMTVELYAGILYNHKEVEKNLKKIQLLMKNTNDKYIGYFYTHIKHSIQKIAHIKDEYKHVKLLNISSKLDILHQKLQNKYYLLLQRGENLLTIFMFSILFMIFSIYTMYKKFLRNKIQLQAYKFAIENSDNSIVITDAEHNITYVNDAFEKETGYKKEEVLGENPRILKSGLMPQEHYTTLTQTLEEHKKWEGEFINKRKNGTLIYEKASINPIVVDGNIENYIAIKLNITKYIEQEKKVEFLALHDPLTTLPNRLNLEQYFNKNILEKNKKAALMYMDLDRFKTINDSLGHHIGDGLLKVFSERLQYALEKDDFIARIGGDEFVIIIEITSNKDANNIARRILNLLKTPINVHGHNLNITTSIGISFFPTDGNDLETLMKHADTAMYRAKKDGRNAFRLFTQQLSDEIDERLEIEQALRKALKNSELYLVYQPKYTLQKRQIIGFEALIRWENEKLGFITPDKFIPIAEEIGVINEIGLFVFEKACRDFLTFKKTNPKLKSIAINISTIQFKEKGFINTLNRLCNAIGIKPSSVELEITESCIMDNIETNIQMLNELQKYGYKIAIDDFGTGYSSFGYLKKLPINTIKIDKSFVDDITIKTADKDIVKAIIGLSKNLGFNTVAEGIETQEQEKLLHKLGCDIGQGYLFSKPQKIEDIKEFIKDHLPQEIEA